MKQGDKARLTVKKHLRKNYVKSFASLEGTVFRYDSKEASLYLILENKELTDVSLDIIYVGEVITDDGKLSFSGRVKERYYNEWGKILKIEIENGFYKISLNSVDKL